MVMRGLMVTIIVFGLSGCILRHSEFPKGTSTLSAQINDSLRFFDRIYTENFILGFRVLALSKGDTIRLHLADGKIGQYTWSASSPHLVQPDTAAYYNSFLAVPGVGGFTISEHSNYDLRAAGTFEFMVVDSLNADTIRVLDGRFVLFYEPTD